MDSSGLETQITELLQRLDLRTTSQRRAIVRQMLNMPGHFSVEDLFLALGRKDVHVSQPTIYRLIPTLVEAGILREVEHRDEHGHYEVVRDRAHHEHLICQRCGKVIEFVCPAIEKAIIGVCREYSFRHYQHDVEIMGLCQECQKEVNGNRLQTNQQ